MHVGLAIQRVTLPVMLVSDFAMVFCMDGLVACLGVTYDRVILWLVRTMIAILPGTLAVRLV